MTPGTLRLLLPFQVCQIPLMMGRLSIAGSFIGGMADTQEVIDFCQEKGILPEIEVIVGAERLAEVYALLGGKNDSIKRYVLDLTKSLD